MWTMVYIVCKPSYACFYLIRSPGRTSGVIRAFHGRRQVASHFRFFRSDVSVPVHFETILTSIGRWINHDSSSQLIWASLTTVHWHLMSHRWNYQWHSSLLYINLGYTYGGQIDPQGYEFIYNFVKNGDKEIFLWWLFLNICPCQNSISPVKRWRALVTLWRHFCDRHSVKFLSKNSITCIFVSTDAILMNFFWFLMCFWVRESIPTSHKCVTFTDDLETQGHVML